MIFSTICFKSNKCKLWQKFMLQVVGEININHK
uniref:Uncharacterized protein n=1 Tax=Myoviridae sp. ct0e511 TaxID=2825013 RepID=A0A8S5QJK4_9CAUD|nr:MAG TPA: hypothetical protein [Myoviridae sp. ct0e511]